MVVCLVLQFNCIDANKKIRKEILKMSDKKIAKVSDIVKIDFEKIETGAALISDFIPIRNKSSEEKEIVAWFADFIMPSGELKGLKFSVTIEQSARPDIDIMELCQFDFDTEKSFVSSPKDHYGLQLRLVAKEVLVVG